jgi:flavin-dependent dehydrogenase
VKKNFDIAVIGAGPAGTAAAIYAAQKGLNVILIDSDEKPKSRPGESLPPGVEILFRQLNIWTDLCELKLIRHPGYYTWQSPHQEKIYHPYGHDQHGEWQDIQILRDQLNHILQKRAQSLDVAFMTKCHIKKIILSNQKIKLISIEKNKNNLIQAKYYIDATGHAHLFSRQLGIDMIKYSAPLIVKYGYFNNHCPYEELPIFIQKPTGWHWYTKVSDNLFAWTGIGLQHHQAAGGRDVTWRIAKKTAGDPGFFLIGDAACMLDPSAGHGVLRAIMTGIMASDLIFNIINNNIFPQYAYHQYHHWLSNWFMHDMHELKKRSYSK